MAGVRGTTIVALITPDYVALRADSRVAAMGAQSNTPTLGCKIQQMDRLFVGIAGIFGESDGFDAYDTAKLSSKRGGKIDTIADRFEQTATLSFTKAIETIPGRGLRRFRKIL